MLLLTKAESSMASASGARETAGVLGYCTDNPFVSFYINLIFILPSISKAFIKKTIYDETTPFRRPAVGLRSSHPSLGTLPK
jgi:hypothetical protein